MIERNALFVDYRVRWKTGGLRPGAFAGYQAGSGDHIRTSVPLHERADPRRLDVRATLRDPFGALWVRELEQKSALKVFVIADVSASMGFVGRHDKMMQLRDVAVSIARSAWRNGDLFGFHAAGETPRTDLALPARVNRGAGEWLARRLAACVPEGSSARGLLRVIPQLPHRRALVFLISDFHWPARDIAEILGSLSHHAVVPIALWDPAETDAIHRHGIAVLSDMESGARRFVWLRPHLIESLRRRRAEREQRLRIACRKAGCAPFFVRDRYDPMQLTRHFLETTV